jgi:hypothetical protein
MDADSCFPELLLAVVTVDVACRCCTLAIGGGNGVYTIDLDHLVPNGGSPPVSIVGLTTTVLVTPGTS